MEIILKTDIANLGSKNDIVTVKNGYGRNYLIPMGYAILATPSAKKVVAENIRQQAHKEAQLKEEAEKLAASLGEVKLVITAKTSAMGKLFGAITTQNFAAKLAEAGFDIDRKKIAFTDVKELGSYKAAIRLHRDVKVEIPFDVVAE